MYPLKEGGNIDTETSYMDSELGVSRMTAEIGMSKLGQQQVTLTAVLIGNSEYKIWLLIYNLHVILNLYLLLMPETTTHSQRPYSWAMTYYHFTNHNCGFLKTKLKKKDLEIISRQHMIPKYVKNTDLEL